MATKKTQVAKLLMASDVDEKTVNKLEHIIKHNIIAKEKVYHVKQIDKTTPKYKVALKLVNKILGPHF